MSTTDDPPLTITEMSKELGLSRQTVQRWRETGVLDKFGEPVDATARPVRYPRSVAVAAGKAFGMLTEDGDPVEGFTGRGGAVPQRPTVSPLTGKRRYYLRHIAGMLGQPETTVHNWHYQRERLGILPEPDELDEWGRPTWYLPTIAGVAASRGLLKVLDTERFTPPPKS